MQLEGRFAWRPFRIQSHLKRYHKRGILMSTLSIIGTKVRIDSEGRYCLNDLHKAALASGSAKEHHKPSEFLRSESVKSFVKAVDLEAGNTVSINTVKGRGKTGTYAVELVAMRYAGWVDPSFEVKVYQAFQALAKGEIEKAKAIATRQQVKDEYLPMTDAVKQLKEMEGGQAKHYHFTSENNLIYRILTGMTAKEFKAENGVESVRDNLTPVEQKCLLSMQRANTTLIELGMDYQDRKVELENLYQRLWLDKLTEENIWLEA